MWISLGRKAGWAGNSMPTTHTTTPPKIERRLAAIMVADVAGYSRLMGADEVGTLSALKEHRRNRIDPTIARHNGRIFKATGDGLLVEFASVVDAVGCAVAIQRAMLAFNAGIHTDRQIVLRIGINVGDIIVDGDDIFGDGVNVAARLEALCEPGGVCISRSANDHVRNKLSLAFADLGAQTVKNIAQSVGVFGLAAKDIATLPDEALPEPEPPGRRTPLAAERRGPTRIAFASGAALVAALAVGSWWMWRERTAVPVVAATTPMSPRPAAYSAQDRRLSVIVLPFENSSGDPRQDDLAAGITRDVTDRFARAGSVMVPAATAASYRGKTVNLQTLGRDHNVHFALTGSARRQDGRLIVSATLFETGSDKTLWSQQFDRPDNSDEWTGIIAQIWNRSIQAETDAEVGRAKREHPESLDKQDLMLAYRASSLSSPSKENDLKSIALVEQALVMDPNYVDALVSKAQTYWRLVDDGYSSDPSADLSTARKAVDRALQLAPEDIWALRRKAQILQEQGDLEGAAALVRQSLEREPLDGYRYRQLGQIQMAQGYFKDALESFTIAKRLGGSPPLPVFSQDLAFGLLGNDRFPEAIAEAQLARAQWQSNVGRDTEGAWLALIAAEIGYGQDVGARADLQKFLATPRTYRTLAEVQKNRQFAANNQLLDGLRRAGMPAE
jgi:class 3 adenylate cyclase/TolB-like protein/tetratricopeptide (TPR) repeat protein